MFAAEFQQLAVGVEYGGDDVCFAGEAPCGWCVELGAVAGFAD